MLTYHFLVNDFLFRYNYPYNLISVRMSSHWKIDKPIKYFFTPKYHLPRNSTIIKKIRKKGKYNNVCNLKAAWRCGEDLLHTLSGNIPASSHFSRLSFSICGCGWLKSQRYCLTQKTPGLHIFIIYDMTTQIYRLL